MTTYPLFVAAASFVFSTLTQNISPATSPGNSQIRTEDPKPPESETPPSAVSNTSDSTTMVADSTDVLGASRHAQEHGGVTKPLHQVLSPPQHDPIIHDTPHVDLIQIPVLAAPRPPPRFDPFGAKPRLQITISAPLEPINSDSPGTAFYTPGGSGEAADRKPFNSAMPIQVTYSSPRPDDVAGPFRRVVGVHQQWNSMYKFPTQPTPVSGNDPGTADTEPRYGSEMSLARPPKVNAGPPTHISGASVSAIPNHEPGSRPRPRLPIRDERRDTGTSKDPRLGRERAVPVWGGSGSGGREGDDCSCTSASADYVSVSNEGEGHSRDEVSTPVSTMRQVVRYMSPDAASVMIQPPSSSSSLFHQMFTKWGASKYPRLQYHALTQAQKNASVSISGARIESTDMPVVDSGRDRERTLSRIPSFLSLRSGLAGMKRNGSRRETK